ncbi:MAG: DMT family transporter [Bacteroidetes bacterium]|nr:DMT family transporter [Bacteroidota bacterium]
MKSTTKAWLLLLLLACIWGSSFILMKKGMYSLDGEQIFSYTQVAALRMVFAGLVLLPFAYRGLRKIKQTKDFGFLLVVGGLGNFIPAFMFTYAETKLSSGYAGMLNSFTPIFTITIGVIFFNTKLISKQIIGLVIGTAGMISLMLFGNSLEGNGGWSHILAIVLATMMYGLSLNTIKHKLQHLKSFEITSIALLLVLLPAIILAYSLGSLDVLKSNNSAYSALGFIAILGVVGTAFAVILFNRLISLKDALFASSVTYFIPIVAVFIGFSFKETINMGQICSMVVVLLGVFLVNWKGIKKKVEKNGID